MTDKSPALHTDADKIAISSDKEKDKIQRMSD